MRIYVPATLDELDSVVATRSAARWSITPREVNGVTRSLVAALPDEDDEGREYEAFLDAAVGSTALLAARHHAPPLRAVVTVEVSDDVLETPPDPPGSTASALRLTAVVPEAEIICVHVDEPAAAPDALAVRQAGEALIDAMERLGERDLLWYDWSEVSSIPR